MFSKLTKKYLPPVIVAGVGGSGTRLIAQCLKDLGFYIGSDLNNANDNLWFTLLFKRIEILNSSKYEFDELVDILFKGMTGSGQFTKTEINSIHKLASLDRDQHPGKWLQERAQSILSEKHILEPDAKWGWKEPNSHIVIDRLKNAIPGMKYVHVMRNGLDMAYSTNQNQLKLWGKHFIGSDFQISPYYSLKYWCVVHQRILKIGDSMGSNILLINYDNLTLHPDKGIQALLRFLELDITETQMNKLFRFIKPPDSIGRFKKYDTKVFENSDVNFVKQMGFVVD